MIYLDNSATSGFKPSAVIQEVENALRFSANPTRSGHKRALSMGQKVFYVRELVSNLFNFDAPQRVIFTKNCTEALNLGILGTLKIGGHVITTENEHNSVLRPLYHLYKNGQIELTILPVYPNGSISLVDLQNAIQKNTYLVVVNHVSNVTGGVNPIEQIGDFLS
ncbi:MAG: aminotransferase class V-fold PLP-dependent enzyme, partial [Clostridia bacterium]